MVEQKPVLPVSGSFLLLTLVLREDQLLLPGCQLLRRLGLCPRCQYVPAEAEEMLGLYFFLSLHRSIAGGERAISVLVPPPPDSQPQDGCPKDNTHMARNAGFPALLASVPQASHLGSSSQPLGDKNLASGAQGEEPQVLATHPKPHLEAQAAAREMTPTSRLAAYLSCAL